MSNLSELQTKLNDWGVENFSARELTQLNTDHDFNDGVEVAIPDKSLWSNMRKTALFADTIRHHWGGPILVAGGGGGGGYRPEWYQQGLHDNNISQAPYGDHCLFAALDLSPADFPLGKTRDDWFEMVCVCMDQVRRLFGEPTALGWRQYYERGDNNVHVMIGLMPDKIPGRESYHARW
jgi:hypothetical protein